jgi:hypothetical protein
MQYKDPQVGNIVCFKADDKTMHIYEVKRIDSGVIIADCLFPDFIPEKNISMLPFKLVDTMKQSFLLGMMATHMDMMKRELSLKELIPEVDKEFYEKYWNSIGSARLGWSDEMLQIIAKL